MKKRSYVALEDIGITFPTAHGPFTALKNVNLSIEKGEFVALIGHSGCGKSTLLNIVAGLTKATRGVVFVDNEVVDRPGVDRAVIFQDHSLLPWLTVEENVRLAVDKTTPGKSRGERRDWVMHNLELVHMTHAAAKRPQELSGGMKQRVGIARAIAMNPRVLLMDEPFGALDSQTRETMQDELLRIWERERKTVVFVTHDLEEALYLSDRVIVMSPRPGRLVADETVTLRRPRPANIRVADEFVAARRRLWTLLASVRGDHTDLKTTGSIA